MLRQRFVLHLLETEGGWCGRGCRVAAACMCHWWPSRRQAALGALMRAAGASLEILVFCMQTSDLQTSGTAGHACYVAPALCTRA